MVKRLLCISLMVILTLSLTGCDVQIFVKPEDKKNLVSSTKDTMTEEIYYVKDGTKFFPTKEVKECINDKATTVTMIKPGKVIWLLGEEGKIPALYNNEILSYTSIRVNNMDNITVERFKDLGYSFGIHDITYTDDGLSFDRDMNTVENSDFWNKIKSTKSNRIVITQINGKDVTENMIRNGNVINGLEKDKEYELSVYSGTYYGTITVKADTQMLQSYELYNLGSIKMTQNGYLSISMPADSKAGYYVINGIGLYKYYNCLKTEVDEQTKINMNEEYYKSDEEQLAAFSQQYSFTLDENKKDVSVVMIYGETEETIRAMVTSPNGTTYKMKLDDDAEKPQMRCDLKEALPGKWTVNVAPSTLGIKEINVESNEINADMTKEEYPISIEADTSNCIFKVEYTGEGKMNGIVIDESGTTYTMRQDEKAHTVIYNANFIKSGNYKIVIYHYPETSVTTATAEKDDNNVETDIITITE